MILEKPTYLCLPSDFYQVNNPRIFPNSKCAIWNENLDSFFFQDKKLNLQMQFTEYLKYGKSDFFQKSFSQAYMGHQFGHLNMLGDGRAHVVGELKDSANVLWELQLKGAGQSQYSRRGDGFASLGPMLREFLVSEAMNSFGVPTTRSLGVFSTNEFVQRRSNEPGGILVRTSQSHVRVGTFQFAFHQGGKAYVQVLADYMIERMNIRFDQNDKKYHIFLTEIVARQANLIARWLSLGFVHGVMNTDNMSIIGETIDYGPCAFLDQYHPLAVFSSIDQQGRYAYMRQVEIAQWNLARLTETMLELFSESMDESKEIAHQVLHDFIQHFQSEWFQLMSKKIGFESSLQSPGAEIIWQMIIDLLDLMSEDKLDFTNTFLFLSGEFQDVDDFKMNEKINLWKNKWLQYAGSVGLEQSQLQMVMKRVNPLVIPRNYLVEEVIEKAMHGNFSPYAEFLFELQSPYQQSEVKKKMQFLPNTTNTNYQTFCGT